MKLKVNFVNSVLFIFVVGIIAVRFLFHSGKCAKMKQVASVAFYSFDTCGQAPFFSDLFLYEKEKAIVSATCCKYFICKLKWGCSLISSCVSSLLQILHMQTEIGMFFGSLCAGMKV